MSQKHANDIEMRAANVAYCAGFGAGEWEAFLTTDEIIELVRLAELGFGTWAQEPYRLEEVKRGLQIR